MEGNFQMKKKAKLLGAYLPMLLTLLPTAVALRTIACFKDMNDSGYFENKTVITIANAIILATVACALTYLFIASKDKKLVYRPQSPLNFIPCAIICAALIFVAINSVISSSPSIKAYFGLFAEDRNLKMLINPALTLLTGLSAASAVPYFVASAVWAKDRSVLISNLGLMPLIFLCFMISSIYFDKTAALNMPGKIISQTAYLAAALFFLYEIRLPLGREKWRAYICFGMVCTALCAYSAIPSLIVYIVSPNTIEALVTSEFEIAMTLAIFFFSAFKLILAVTLTEDKESAITQKVREFSLARSASLEQPTEESNTADEPEQPAELQAEETVNEEFEQNENQESFFGELIEEKAEAITEESNLTNEVPSELEEISEARRLELSANIDNTPEEDKKEADNQ